MTEQPIQVTEGQFLIVVTTLVAPVRIFQNGRKKSPEKEIF